MNGLIRQYIPKGTSLEDIDDEYIEIIQEKLNNRPRKKLGFLTPYEYFFLLLQKIMFNQSCICKLNAASVDWSKFDKAEVLSEITATVDECSHEDAKAIFEVYGLDKLPVAKKLCFDEFHGTVLCISNLRDRWSGEELNSMLGNLEMLVPEHLKSLFTLYLYNLQDLSWSGEIYPVEYSDYDYKVDAAFDGVRTIHAFVERNELNVSLLETKYSSVFQRKSMQNSPYRLEDFRAKTIAKSLIT